MPVSVLIAPRWRRKSGHGADEPEYCSSMTRSRLVFDHRKDLLPSEIVPAIPLGQKIFPAVKSLTDLTRHLVQFSG